MNKALVGRSVLGEALKTPCGISPVRALNAEIERRRNQQSLMEQEMRKRLQRLLAAADACGFDWSSWIFDSI